MVYLHHISCLRYTILVRNSRYDGGCWAVFLVLHCKSFNTGHLYLQTCHLGSFTPALGRDTIGLCYTSLSALELALTQSFPPSVQALEWIEEYGEAYLSSHTHLGSSNTETEALLKEHYEFRNRAKVRLSALCVQ